MRKIIFILSIALFVTAFRAAAAMAVEPVGALEKGTHNSAGVEKGFLCVTGPGGETTQTHATISNSGRETLICQGDLDVAGPGKALVFDGLPCTLFFGGLTFNSRLIITPAGIVNLTCKSD